jgi:DmsE family decaheme c-type cytochrome
MPAWQYLRDVALTKWCKTGVVIGVAAAVILLLGGVRAEEQKSAAPAAKPPEKTTPAAQYIGAETCAACHADPRAKIAPTPMGKIMLQFPRSEEEKRGCEACHGPGSKHIENPADPTGIIRFGKKSVTPAKMQNEACSKCHDKGQHLWWKNSEHAKRAISCTQCHKIHSGSDKGAFSEASELDLCATCHPQRKAQTLRNSHMPQREGKITCSDCHNPHGSNGPSMLTSKSVNENCYRCHAEKRGPFLWEHPPVRENCLNCHDPHGTAQPNLLRMKSGYTRLCQRCHTASRHPSQPFGTVNDRRVYNHNCLNCHSQIHGSNHPSGGEFFLR